MKKTIFVAVLLAAANVAVADVVVRDGEREWRFAEVNGTSRLALTYTQAGVNENDREDVTLPRYWIAREMVTEGDFARLMGRKVRKGRDADKPVTRIEWAEALEFTERFTKKYQSQFPTNCIASMPLSIEWAHAVRVTEGKVDLCGDAGTFLFTMNSFSGFMHTHWKGAKLLVDATNANEVLAWRFVSTPKRCKRDRVGLRMVLVDVTKHFSGRDEHPIEIRGEVALRLGYVDESRHYLNLAIDKGMMSSNDLARAKRCLEFAYREREYGFEDWSGIVAVPASFAQRRGYQIEPFATKWMMLGWEGMESREVVAEYEKRGISGRFVCIGDLPPEIRKDQRERDTHSICIWVDDDLQSVDMPIGSNTLVQVLDCDFTGDGRKDKVVEVYDAVGSDGYCYNFYQQLQNGAYTNVLELQTVGLCALPKKGGGACGFLCVDKVANPVLSVRLLTLQSGEACFYEAVERPIYILDVDENHIYGPAPFIGAGYGLGWQHIEGMGRWYRPLFWPWKQGEVPGYDDALEKAKKAATKAKMEKECEAEQQKKKGM